MRTIKRAVHMDFHTMPAIPDFARDFDAAEFAEGLKTANVDWITFFARCNIGHSYYDTKVGMKHPYHDGDLLGSLLAECKKRDIALAAYFNAGLNHAFADIHRDWLIVNQDGSIYCWERGENFFRSMCYNTGYRDHLKAELAELLALHPDLDGYFFDCMCAFPCYCGSCVDRMNAEGVDIGCEAEVLAFQARIRNEVVRELRAMIPDGKFAFFNGSYLNSGPFPSMVAEQTHHEIECLPTSPAWGYDTFPAAVAYSRNVLDQVVFMTGRFQINWGDYGGLRTKESIEFDCFYALSQGATCSVGDHLHPRGRIEPAVYGAIGEVYGKIRETEPWTLHAKAVTEIGVLFHSEPDLPVEAQGDLRIALNGATRMLSELNYQFDIIDDTMDFSRFRLIILPDCISLSESSMKKLDKYIESGGKVISSGRSGLNADGDGFGSAHWKFKYNGPDEWDNGFYRPGAELTADTNDMVTSIYHPGIRMEAGPGAVQLAEYWQPYFSHHWDGHHAHFYIPYDHPDGAAVAATDSVAHVCFPVFTSYQRTITTAYKYMLRNLIRRFLPEPILEAEVPSFARVSLTRKEPYTLLHLLSYCPEARAGTTAIEEPIILRNVAVKIRAERAPSTVYEVPSRKPIPFTWNDGLCELVLPEVNGHIIVALED